MQLINIVIFLFIVLESLNVMSLYFHIDVSYNNNVTVFKAFEESKSDESLHLFIRYMTYWVAGAKLMFIGILIVVLLVGTPEIKFWVSAVSSLNVLTYYWRLHPILRQLDKMGRVRPIGYSKILGMMVGTIVFMFTVPVVIYMVMY